MIKNIIIYILLVLFYFFIEGYTLENFEEKMWLQSFKDIIIYIPAFLLSVYFIFLILINKNKIIRFIMYFLLFIITTVFLGYKEINGFGFGIIEARIAVSEIMFASEAFDTYFKSFIRASLYAIAILIIVILIIEKIANKKNTNFQVIILSFIFIFYGFLSTGGTISQKFNIIVKFPYTIYYAVQNKLYNGNRDKVFTKPDNQKIKNIIYIVDESVRGDMLDINNNTYKTNPYLTSIKSKIINYGIASSGANCSAKSNIILLSGLQITDFPDNNERLLKNPSLFQYANNSGYNTVYINNQPSRMQTYFTSFDFKSINKIYQVVDIYPKFKAYDRDIESIKFIKKELDKNKSNFFYINKYGSHFHYENAYPQDKNFFTPTLKRGEWGDNKRKMMNSYKNAINWSVDNYFKELLKVIKDRNDTIVVYTSNHGQNIGNSKILTTHCNTANANSYEANVPLFIIPFVNSKLTDKLKLNVKNNYNKVSHFKIFPTLKRLMGYKNEKCESLFSTENKKRFFISGDLFNRNGLFIKKEFLYE